MRFLFAGCLALALLVPAAQGATFQTETHVITTTVDGLTGDIADFADIAALKGSADTVVHITVTDRKTGESFVFPCDMPVLREYVASIHATLPKTTTASRNVRIFLGLVTALQVKVNPPGPRPEPPKGGVR